MWSETILWSELYQKGEMKQFFSYSVSVHLRHLLSLKGRTLSVPIVFTTGAIWAVRENIPWQPVGIQAWWGLTLVKLRGVLMKKKSINLWIQNRYVLELLQWLPCLSPCFRSLSSLTPSSCVKAFGPKVCLLREMQTDMWQNETLSLKLGEFSAYSPMTSWYTSA